MIPTCSWLSSDSCAIQRINSLAGFCHVAYQVLLQTNTSKGVKKKSIYLPVTQ